MSTTGTITSIDGNHVVIASVKELDRALFPNETDNDDNDTTTTTTTTTNHHHYHHDDNGDPESNENNAANRQRQMQSLTTSSSGNSDDGSEIDILCLYTRQALESLCEDSNGRKCEQNYMNYEVHMKQRCQLGIDQTVSVVLVGVLVVVVVGSTVDGDNRWFNNHYICIRALCPSNILNLSIYSLCLSVEYSIHI